MISSLKEITGSLTKSLDIIYVLEDVKKVSRILVDEEDKLLIDFLSRNSLYHELSDFKIIKHIDNIRGFTDKGIKAAKGDKRKGSHLLYLSKEKELAKAAKEMEQENKQFELGKILGYPECCCRFFDKNYDEAIRRTNDLTVNTFRESKGFNFPWQNNNCLRGFDISLISHFPCSFGCEESKNIAEKNIRVIEKYDSDIANYFRSALKCAVIYSEGIGVYSFKRFKINKGGMSYSSKDVVASVENDLYNLIRRRDTFKILGKNHFQIGEVDIEDDHTFFGLFS